MSTENWTLEKDLCRCCHAEGNFKNLAEPCSDLGQEEIYADMLKYCFDINLVPVPGLLCAVTYTICEACIAILRDAAKFKRTVASCEEKFKDLYNRNVIKVEEPHIDIKVKEELPDSCNDDDFSPADDNNANFDDLPEYGYDEDDDKTDPEETVKKKPRKVQLKKSDKPKGKKKVGRPKKMKEEPIAEEEGDKRKGRGTYYTITQNRYSCNECERSFASQPLVSQHYRFVHLKKRPRDRKCPKCDDRIPGYLRAYHLENKHGIPAPSCGVCGKKFRFPCHVLQHQKKVHMGEKTAVCHICQKSFFNQLNLRLHMSTHSSVKKFKCEICSREFRWENNLKDHVKIHTGDKKFVCRVCDKAFVQKSTLKQHTARKHPGVKVS